MTTSIAIQGRFFYLFLGIHSFLLGLFPFFLPVFLYKTGHGVDLVAQLIGFTGVGFCLALRLWDTTRASGCRSSLSFLFMRCALFMTAMVQNRSLFSTGYSSIWNPIPG